MGKAEISYLTRRLKTLGIKASPSFEYNVEGRKVIQEYFSEDKTNGNIRIFYPALDAQVGIETYDRGTANNPQAPYFRLRKAETAAGENKYHSPKGAESRPFYPPNLLACFRAGKPIDTLFLTEGEFKAFKGDAHGLRCVGVAGIMNIHGKDKGVRQAGLHHEIKRIVQVCGVKQLVMLYDSDLFDLPRNEEKDLTARALNFINAIKNWKSACVDACVKAYWAYLRPGDGGEKLGLDDLLVAHKKKTAEITTDISGAVDKCNDWVTGAGKHIRVYPNDVTNQAFLAELFSLDDHKKFFARHGKALEGRTAAMFRGQTYKLDAESGNWDLVYKDGLLQVRIKDDSYIKEGDSGWKRISNFAMKILESIIIDSNNTLRVIEFRSPTARTRVMKLNVDNLIDINSFQRVLGLGSDLWFLGDAADLRCIRANLLKDEHFAEPISRFGLQPEGFWVYSDGIFTNDGFSRINDSGTVNFGDRRYYIRNVSAQIGRETEKIDSARDYRYIEPRADFRIKDYINLLRLTFGEAGDIAACFAISALFRGQIWSQLDWFPLLWLAGPPATGKSSLARAVSNIYRKSNGFSLEARGNTTKGLMFTLASVYNGVIFFDEYKNSLEKNMIGFLKGIYDGAGSVKGTAAGENTTANLPILSSIVVAGQEVPTVDEALMSRSIIIQFWNSNWQNKEAYRRLKDEIEDGLSYLIGDMLPLNDSVIAKFKTVFREIVERLRGHFSEEKKELERLLGNAAAVLAPVFIGIRENLIDFPRFGDAEKEQYLIQCFVNQIKAQLNLIYGATTIANFWDDVDDWMRSNTLMLDDQYKVKDGVLYLRVKKAFEFYAEKQGRISRGGLTMDKTSLIGYLKADKAYLGEKTAVRFNGKITTCYMFDVKKLEYLSFLNPQKEEIAPEPMALSDEAELDAIIKTF